MTSLEHCMCVTVITIVLLCINFCNSFIHGLINSCGHASSHLQHFPSLLLFSIAVRTFNTEVYAEVWWRGTVQ